MAVKPPEAFPVAGQASTLNLETPGFVKGYEPFGMVRKLTVDYTGGQTITAENGLEGLLLQDAGHIPMQPYFTPSAKLIGENVPNRITLSNSGFGPFGSVRRELHFDNPFQLFSKSGRPVQVTDVVEDFSKSGGAKTAFVSNTGRRFTHLFETPPEKIPAV